MGHDFSEPAFQPQTGCKAGFRHRLTAICSLKFIPYASIISIGMAIMMALGASLAGAAEKQHILIGSHLPLTGLLATNGIEQQWAYKIAVEDINRSGGIFVKEFGEKMPVRLIILDDESDPGKSAAAVEQLIKHYNVDLILSGCTAPFGVIPGCVTAEKYGKYYHATACFPKPWLEHHLQWSTLLFFNISDAANAPFKVIASLPKEIRPQKIASFMEDTFDGRAMGAAIVEVGEKRGFTFSMIKAVSPGTEDFTAEILEAKSKGVDGIFFFSATSDIVAFIRQMKHNRFSVPYFHGFKGTWPAEFWQTLGQDAQYVVSDGFWSEDYPFPGSKALGERYFRQFNKSSVAVGQYYGLCQILWQAIEKAGSLDSEKVRKAVIGNEFQTIMGLIRYDDRGVGLFPYPAFQWMDGKPRLLMPFEWAKDQFAPAIPWQGRP